MRLDMIHEDLFGMSKDGWSAPGDPLFEADLEFSWTLGMPDYLLNSRVEAGQHEVDELVFGDVGVPGRQYHPKGAFVSVDLHSMDFFGSL